MKQTTQLLYPKELAQVLLDIYGDEQKHVKAAFVTLLDSISTLVNAIEALKGNKACFCSMPIHTTACKQLMTKIKFFGDYFVALDSEIKSTASDRQKASFF